MEQVTSTLSVAGKEGEGCGAEEGTHVTVVTALGDPWMLCLHGRAQKRITINLALFLDSEEPFLHQGSPSHGNQTFPRAQSCCSSPGMAGAVPGGGGTAVPGCGSARVLCVSHGATSPLALSSPWSCPWALWGLPWALWAPLGTVGTPLAPQHPQTPQLPQGG